MKTVIKVYCILFLLTKAIGLYASTCRPRNVDETREERENSYANVSYLLNNIGNSDKFRVLFEVCEGNKLVPHCTFSWRKQSHKVTTVNWSPGNETTCFINHRNISSSVFTFEIEISLFIKRSYRLLKLSVTDNEETPNTLRLIRLDVLYLPKVTSLTVDGHEINGDYFIDEDQNVTVTCSFDEGNPPILSRMFDRTGRELVCISDGGKLSHSLVVKCENDWPTIQCGEPGSKYNRYVSFLLRCPPQFVDNSTKFIPISTLHKITFKVKAHTSAIEMCFLIPETFENEAVREVNCTLNGNPPYFVLSLHLAQETNFFIRGKWMLLLRNERGSAKTILSVPKYSVSERSGGVPVYW